VSAPANVGGANGDDAARLAKAPFAASLRARPETIRVGPAGAGSWMVRVQMPEVWDAVRLDVAPSVSVLTLKQSALAELKPEGADSDEFVTKLNGIEVLDEEVSLAEAGALNGSTFLVTYRRRRPVR